jgi:hypothetical protein
MINTRTNTEPKLNREYYDAVPADTRAVDWPDLSVDQRAWEQAKRQAGPNASVSAIAKRAQAIKLSMNESDVDLETRGGHLGAFAQGA